MTTPAAHLPDTVHADHVITNHTTRHAGRPAGTWEGGGGNWQDFNLRCGGTHTWSFPTTDLPPAGEVTCKRCIRGLRADDRAADATAPPTPAYLTRLREYAEVGSDGRVVNDLRSLLADYDRLREAVNSSHERPAAAAPAAPTDTDEERDHG